MPTAHKPIFISWLLTEIFQTIAYAVCNTVPSWLNRRDSKH